MAFFLSNDVINYCYHVISMKRTEEHWELGTLQPFFCQFVSSPIIWFLSVKQNLSEPKLNLLLLWSCCRQILKEGRVKRLLPQSRSGLIMNRKGRSWHALRARNAHLLLSGFDLLHHAEFSLVRRPQIKLIYFGIEDGNSPLFNDQFLIKRADNAPSRVNTFIYCGNDFNLQQGKYSYVLITLSCPFALSFRFILCSK